MCFKKPSAPPPTPEELAMQADAAQQRQQTQQDLADQMAREKASTTQLAIARQGGLYGIRSLIMGPKGGGGFGLRSLI